MSPLRAATSGATTAWGPFSSPIGTPRLAIRVGAAASTIIRCNGAGGKMRHAARRPHVRSGPWLCENALAEALTNRDFGELTVFGHLAVFGGLFCLERLLMRIPAVLSGSATGYGHMSATTMPASPPAAVGRP